MRGDYYSSYRRYSINTPSAYIYAFVACILCWVVCYVYSVGYPVYGEVMAPPLWNVICQVLPTKALTYIIGIGLTVGGAFLLHRANYALMLVREKTLLPFLFFVLFISTNPDFFPLKSTSLGVFCLILAIYELFTSYHDPDSMDKAYNAALLIGTGSLLWIHILWFMPLFWYGMYSFRSLNVRTFIASLLGLTTVYWFLFGWCVWQKDFAPFIIPFSSLAKMNFLLLRDADYIDWISLSYIAALIVVASINIIVHEYEDNLRTRQFLYFVILLAVWSFVMFFFYEQSSEENLEMACVPASILIGHFFTVVRNKYVFWLFHFTIVLFIGLLFARIWSFL